MKGIVTMKATASKNLVKRIQLLKETRNRLQRDINNGYKVSRQDVNDYYKELIYCKQLCKKEMLEKLL